MSRAALRFLIAIGDGCSFSITGCISFRRWPGAVFAHEAIGARANKILSSLPVQRLSLRDAVTTVSTAKRGLTLRDQHLDVYYVDYHMNVLGRTMRHVAVCRQEAGLVGWNAPGEHG